MDLNSNPINQNPDKGPDSMILNPTRISRFDLFESNFNRHLNECKSYITFLGSFCNYEDLREELNSHIDKLINEDYYGL